VNKRKSTEPKRELPKGVDGTRPGIDKGTYGKPLSNQFQVWDGLAEY